jgi:hypothetical protein
MARASSAAAVVLMPFLQETRFVFENGRFDAPHLGRPDVIHAG